MEWCVGVMQVKPFEYINLEVFTEECDAIRFAEEYMQSKPGRKITKRTWLILRDEGSNLKLQVWKR
jgi:hypothetical protein